MAEHFLRILAFKRKVPAKLSGCQLILQASHNTPNVIIDDDVRDADGVDIRVLIVMAEHLDVHLKVQTDAAIPNVFIGEEHFLEARTFQYIHISTSRARIYFVCTPRHTLSSLVQHITFCTEQKPGFVVCCLSSWWRWRCGVWHLGIATLTAAPPSVCWARGLCVWQ
jgi:hypothetical protein